MTNGTAWKTQAMPGNENREGNIVKSGRRISCIFYNIYCL